MENQYLKYKTAIGIVSEYYAKIDKLETKMTEMPDLDINCLYIRAFVDEKNTPEEIECLDEGLYGFKGENGQVTVVIAPNIPELGNTINLHKDNHRFKSFLKNCWQNAVEKHNTSMGLDSWIDSLRSTDMKTLHDDLIRPNKYCSLFEIDVQIFSKEPRLIFVLESVPIGECRLK